MMMRFFGFNNFSTLLRIMIAQERRILFTAKTTHHSDGHKFENIRGPDNNCVVHGFWVILNWFMCGAMLFGYIRVAYR